LLHRASLELISQRRRTRPVLFIFFSAHSGVEIGWRLETLPLLGLVSQVISDAPSHSFPSV